MQYSNDLWKLMARCLSGEASAEERDELMHAMRTDELMQTQYDLLSRFWQTEAAINLIDNDEIEKGNLHVARILKLAKTDSCDPENKNFDRRLQRRKIYKKISVAFFALFITAVFIWWTNNKINLQKSFSATQQKIIATLNGNRTKIILPDGTSVWLNSGSKLSYGNNFAGPLREVRLEGEAYFDVVKNPARPFVVHTAGIDIKVLGTAFNVKSYPSDTAIETTLIHGLVQVTRAYDAKQKPIILHPNQKLIIEKIIAAESSLKLSHNAVVPNNEKRLTLPYHISVLDSLPGEDSHIETAWVYNRLAFRGDNFEQLAQKLERWYNIKIIFEDEKVKRLTFNGSFESETPEQAFIALKAAASFNFKIQNDEISISSSN
jgi:transmembrane sensor